MFEEVLEHKALHPTSSKRSQLAHLIRAQTHNNVLIAIERDLRPRLLTNAQRLALRNRVIEEYAKRPMPESTFETWHFNEERNHSLDRDHRSRDDSDDWMQEDFNQSTKKRKRRKTKTPKQREYQRGDFDLYVKETLVQEIKADKDTQPEVTRKLQQMMLSGSDLENCSILTLDPNGDGDTEEEDSDSEMHPDAIYARKTLSELDSGLMSKPLQLRNRWALDRFIAMSWGWDIPGASKDALDYSLLKLHIRSLKILMHISILKKQWEAAYRVFSVLIRFDLVDIRAIWPLGLEIVMKRKQELLKDRKVPKSELSKEVRFMDWLALSYPAARVKFVQKRTYQGPVYRSGSRTHAPLSIITGLWNLLVEQKYMRVREDLDDLLLHPPYATDGTYSYLLATCCIIENMHLLNVLNKFDQYSGFFDDSEPIGDLAADTSLFSSKETIKTRILENNVQARKLLQDCENLNFAFPKEEMELHLNEIRVLIGLERLIPAEENTNFRASVIGSTNYSGEVNDAGSGKLFLFDQAFKPVLGTVLKDALSLLDILIVENSPNVEIDAAAFMSEEANALGLSQEEVDAPILRGSQRERVEKRSPEPDNPNSNASDDENVTDADDQIHSKKAFSPTSSLPTQELHHLNAVNSECQSAEYEFELLERLNSIKGADVREDSIFEDAHSRFLDSDGIDSDGEHFHKQSQ